MAFTTAVLSNMCLLYHLVPLINIDVSPYITHYMLGRFFRQYFLLKLNICNATIFRPIYAKVSDPNFAFVSLLLNHHVQDTIIY